MSFATFITVVYYCMLRKRNSELYEFLGFCINNKEDDSLTNFPLWGFS